MTPQETIEKLRAENAELRATLARLKAQTARSVHTQREWLSPFEPAARAVTA